MLPLALLPLLAVSAPRPVLMFHGVSSGAGEMATLAKEMQSRGIPATSLPLFQGSVDSLVNLKIQVMDTVKYVRKLVNGPNASIYANGYDFVCKSQGGLICRCVIEEMDDHRVNNFVSLAGPQMGVWGKDFFASLGKDFPVWAQNLTADEIWRVAYTTPVQDTLSVSNMWRDPHHTKEFLAHSHFLPEYNGLAPDMPAATLARYKGNFLRLRQAVFCVGSGSPYDGGIEPWQSGAFGFVDGSAEGGGKSVPMAQHAEYSKDLFGLRTLDESGRLNITIVPGVRHADWTGNIDIIRKYVLPWVGGS